MTRTGIECFLSICRYKTISHAAEKLFITQSSLSMRLKTLEAELGGKLFYRKKGAREITLTAAGKEFHKLALQYEALEKEMHNVFKKHSKALRISSSTVSVLVCSLSFLNFSSGAIRIFTLICRIWISTPLLTKPQFERVKTLFPLPGREISLVVAADNYDPIIPCLCECIDDAIASHERINSLL